MQFGFLITQPAVLRLYLFCTVNCLSIVLLEPLCAHFFCLFFFLFFFFFFLNSVLRPFQDYFSSNETGQSVCGGSNGKTTKKKQHLTQPQAKLGLSHMWPEGGSNAHHTQQ